MPYINQSAYIHRMEFNEAPDHVRAPIYLTIEEMNDPMKVIKSFWEEFDIVKVRQSLDDTLQTAEDQPGFKGNWLLISEIKRLAEASFQLFKLDSEKNMGNTGVSTPV